MPDFNTKAIDQIPEKQKHFIFMDESGNNSQDLFFILGILIVRADQIASLINFLTSIASQIQAISKSKIEKRLDIDYQNGNFDRILSRAKSMHSFEMKFSYINDDNEYLYRDLLKKYFTFPDIRFCAIVFDRKNPDFQPDNMSHLERYLNNAALLITHNVKSFTTDEFVIIADHITQPRSEAYYENTLLEKVRGSLQRMGLDSEKAWGVLRLESHSSALLQLVDILVGAISYDFQSIYQPRKEEFMKLLHQNLGLQQRIQDNFTTNSPNYFSVWKFKPSS